MDAPASPAPTVTIYHPVSGMPIGTAPAGDKTAAKKILDAIRKKDEKVRAMAGYSICGWSDDAE